MEIEDDHKGFREIEELLLFDSMEGGDGSHKRSERQGNRGWVEEGKLGQ